MTRTLRARTLSSRFVALTERPDVPAGHGVLGIVNYTNTCFNPDVVTGHPELSVHLVDNVGNGFSEVWTSSRPVESGEHKAIAYAHDGEHLFCAGRIPPCTEYTYATRLAFRAALELAGTLGYAHVFRMWNFFDNLTESNYQDFLRGQAEAFAKRPVTWNGLPAATTVGSLGGGLAFHFLASRTNAPTTLLSPAGARATYLDDRVYFSASTLDDVEHLISAGNLRRHGLERGYELADLSSLKVYVRHPRDMVAVQRTCEERLLPETAVAYLHAGLLRHGATVEFEGVAG